MLLLTKPLANFSRNLRCLRKISLLAGINLSQCGRVSTKCGCICPVLTRTVRLWRNFRWPCRSLRTFTWVFLSPPLVLTLLTLLILTTWKAGFLNRLMPKPRTLLILKHSSREVSKVRPRKEWQDSNNPQQNSTSSSLVSPMKKNSNGIDPQQPTSSDG